MKVGSLLLSALIFLVLAAGDVEQARAQSAPTAIVVGRGPVAVAVNPTSARVYVANEGSNTISVVDATTDQVIATIPVGRLPSSVAVNPITNRIYVASLGANSLSVIDGASNRVYVTSGRDTITIFESLTGPAASTLPKAGGLPVAGAIGVGALLLGIGLRLHKS